jgi:uncharacterized protein (DUF169 family)
MMTQQEFNQCGQDIAEILMLKTSPVAVKMLEKASDIPKGAVRPKRDRNYHLAQCQAFALSRRNKMTIAMLKEDHWCPAALIAYGMVPRPTPLRGHPYTSFEEGKYIGVLTAPLETADFKPDVVIIYSNTSQLRSLMLSMKLEDGLAVKSHYFPPSCAYAVVHVMLENQSYIVFLTPASFSALSALRTR